MATEMARYAFYGMIIGGIFFGILFGYYFFTAARMTDAEKSEINNATAINCTKCLVKENISCSAFTLQYTSYGAICETSYVPRNCTSTCKWIK